MGGMNLWNVSILFRNGRFILNRSHYHNKWSFDCQRIQYFLKQLFQLNTQLVTMETKDIANHFHFIYGQWLHSLNIMVIQYVTVGLKYIGLSMWVLQHHPSTQERSSLIITPWAVLHHNNLLFIYTVIHYTKLWCWATLTCHLKDTW